MASGGGSGLKEAFDKYSRFGKTETQLKEKELRIESKNIQKMMKDGGILNTKYTTQLLDNDVARVLGKLTIGGTYPKGTWVSHFRDQRRGNELFSILAKHLSCKASNYWSIRSLTQRKQRLMTSSLELLLQVDLV